MASESEQIAAGFWRAVAEDFISHHLIKPVLGRSYLKLGQCFGLWGYLFELGGMLGAKHRAKLDAFVPAFMGMSGEAGAAERFLVPVANKLLDQYSLNSMKCWDFVGADLGDRVSYYKRTTGVVLSWSGARTRFRLRLRLKMRGSTHDMVPP